jgi:hypothetical protein
MARIVRIAGIEAQAKVQIICVLAAIEREKGKKGPLALASERRAA